LQQASQVTAGVLAQSSDWFWATPSLYRQPTREGPLSGTPDARQRLVDELFAWFAEVQPEGFGAQMRLNSGDRWVLDAHDGFPGPLHLRPEEFVELQSRLTSAGLPRDLYYPILDQREVIEPGPSMIGGGVVRRAMFFSPLQWAARLADDNLPRLALPTEEERRRTFAEACDSFRNALMLRMEQLREPGQPERSDEVEQLEDLFLPVQELWLQARGVDVAQHHSLRQEPVAGWTQPPSAFQAITTALPGLRRLHPDAYIWQLFSERARAERPIRRWNLSLWLPSRGRSIAYRVIDGVLFGPGSEFNIDASSAQRIWTIADDELPELIDSPTAFDRVEAEGGHGYRARTRGELGELRLYGLTDGQLSWLASYGRHYPRLGMRVWLNARDGELIAKQEDPAPPPSPP